jgi:predicted DCC family thiol-disulfide oxidoreductase YuxK
MNTLYVLYDPACPHSVRHGEWLARQEPLVPLRLLTHQAEEVPCRFPGIEAHLTPRELTVISDDGQLWTGPGASVMCLFMLEQYREFAERLACPQLLPYARTTLELFSRDRNFLAIQSQFRRSTDAELEHILRMNTEAVAQRLRLPPLPVQPAARV